MKDFQIRDSDYFWEGFCTAPGMIEVKGLKIWDSDYFLEVKRGFGHFFLAFCSGAHQPGCRRRTGHLFWWEIPKAKNIQSPGMTASAGPHHVQVHWPHTLHAVSRTTAGPPLLFGKMEPTFTVFCMGSLHTPSNLWCFHQHDATINVKCFICTIFKVFFNLKMQIFNFSLYFVGF